MQTEAMVIDRHGGPSVIERRTILLADPEAGQARVRVHAVAMNHMDLWVRRGGPHFKVEYPHRLGCDIAGVVEQLGAEAEGVAVGDRVMLQPGVSCGTCRACLSGRDNLCRRYRILGENLPGGYARHVVVPLTNLVPIGDELDFVDAAALPLCTLTAWQMAFTKAQVRPGETVLVHAAGSGVSTMLIQLCALAGARVIATTSSPSKREKARALGASDVVVTSEQDYVSEVRRLTKRGGPDVVFDHLGGEMFEKSLGVVAWGGRIVTCGATIGHAAALDLRHVFFRQVEVLGSTMGSKGQLLEALPLIRSGRLRAPIDRVMSLWDAPKAHEALESKAIFGKLVLTVD